LVPHVFNPGHNDLAVARQIHEEVGCKDKVRVLEGSKDPEELKGIIGLFDMFIAMRHHPLVHSVSQSVPTIGVDYTFKMREVMEAMNCGEWVLDMRTLTVGELVQKACALWYSRKYVQAQLESKVGEMKRRAMLSAELAKELASSAR
jgi:polysaccharide pyruvyl transferase WcaK-like protein